MSRGRPATKTPPKELPVQAETLAEARFLPEDEQTDSLYNRVYAAMDLHYVRVNPAAQICGIRNRADVSSYMAKGFRRTDQQPTKERIVRLIYPKGHPDNPVGGEHDYPHPYVMMACTQERYRQLMAEENQRTRYPGDAEDHMDKMAVLSPMGSLMEDKTLGSFGLSVSEGFRAGNNVDSPSSLAARDASIERGYQKMQDLGLDKAIEAAAESKIAE